MDQNRKNKLTLITVTIIGILMNVASEVGSMYLGLHLHLRFPGTILVTFLCGAFPGMLAEAGSIVLRYAASVGRSSISDMLSVIPIYDLLNAAVVALIVDRFIRRGMYRHKRNILLLLPILALSDAILSTVIPFLDMFCDVGMLEADVLETMRSLPEQLAELFAFSDFVVRVGNHLLRFGVTLAVALAIFHLLPAKLRESISNSQWMQAPLPAAMADRAVGTKSRHSLKTRITALLGVAIVLSTGILTLINASNTAIALAYNQATKLINAGMFVGSVLTQKGVEGYLEEGVEAGTYEETAELLHNYVECSEGLSRLYVLRMTEADATVIFDAAGAEQPTQSFGEALADKSIVEPFIESGLEWIEDYDIYDMRQGGKSIYVGIVPIQGDDGAPYAYVVSEIINASILSNVVFSVIRIVIEFSGIFIILIAFGLWFSRYYMVYPIASMSAQANSISVNLDDLGSLDQNIQALEALDIHTEDETETLYKAVCQMAQSVSKRMKDMQSLFGGMVMSLVNAIDAKDIYTHGHSNRVAQYSRRIAELAGKNEKECEEIYLSALLHDVGKIGIPERIINKKGRLTDEEYAAIKQHPAIGCQILEEIREYPYLSVAAHYHHERYDGRGYPEGLKGEAIPEIGRIIAVADAYDAMTSNRSYRNAIPQHLVREELVKGSGTQFDPAFAQIMIQMIDHDTDYMMQERKDDEAAASAQAPFLSVDQHTCTEGIIITGKKTRIRFCSQPDEDASAEEPLPVLIAFDSLDGNVHPGEENNRDLLYYEYARIRLDGQVTERNARRTDVRIANGESDLEIPAPESGSLYRIEAIRRKDHALIRITDAQCVRDVILALPDNSRFMYLAIGCDHCRVHNILVETDEAETEEQIPRIAEEISFIRGCPEGDVPNIEVDGWRTDATEGIRITDGMKLSFHAMSLPTARMIWHCPFISVFSSADGSVDGPEYCEYMLLRLDGENWESDERASNKVDVCLKESFAGWNDWKDRCKQGIDCTVSIGWDGNQITMQTENLGVAIRSVTTIMDKKSDVRVSLTGDQCAITNIRVLR